MAIIDPSWELQKAVYTAITGDADVKTVIGNPARVYDHVPEGAVFPYITIGEGGETDESTMGKRNEAHSINVHIWSQYRGRKEVKQIMAAIHPVLHMSSLSLNGVDFAGMIFESSNILRDPDGLTWHGIQSFRAITCQQ